MSVRQSLPAGHPWTVEGRQPSAARGRSSTDLRQRNLRDAALAKRHEQTALVHFELTARNDGLNEGEQRPRIRVPVVTGQAREVAALDGNRVAVEVDVVLLGGLRRHADTRLGRSWDGLGKLDDDVHFGLRLVCCDWINVRRISRAGKHFSPYIKAIMRKAQDEREDPKEARPADQAGIRALRGARGDTDDATAARKVGEVGRRGMGAKSNRQSADEKRLARRRKKNAEELVIRKARTANALSAWVALHVEWRAAMTAEQKAKANDGRASSSRARARRYGCDGTHTGADIAALVDLQGDKCAQCEITMHDVYHVDHIVALRRGGTNGPENLQLLCPPCNMKKGCREKPE